MNTQNQIDDIMDNFDFRKVLRTMRLLEWKWADVEGKRKVPEERHLRSTARCLLKRAAAEKVVAGSGGFVAAYAAGWLSLSFVVADYIPEEES